MHACMNDGHESFLRGLSRVNRTLRRYAFRLDLTGPSLDTAKED